MINTSTINQWTQNPTDIGPMYPLVGWEIPMLILCLILWGLYTIWQLRHEASRYDEEIKALEKDYQLIRIVQEQQKR